MGSACKSRIPKFDHSSFYDITIKLVMELFKFLVSISQFLVRLVSFFFPRYISNHLHGLFARGRLGRVEIANLRAAARVK